MRPLSGHKCGMGGWVGWAGGRVGGCTCQAQLHKCGAEATAARGDAHIGRERKCQATAGGDALRQSGAQEG